MVPTLRFDYYEIPRSSFSFLELVKFGILPKQKRIIEKNEPDLPNKDNSVLECNVGTTVIGSPNFYLLNSPHAWKMIVRERALIPSRCGKS